jgi:ATP-dependent exoDNAse (exonuclease V) beta subunit
MRFLKLLGEVNDPQEIIALTFTEKATGEMCGRIGRYLDMARRGEKSASDPDEELIGLASRALQRHGERLIMSSDRLNIMTFHGLCAYISRRAPLEAGLAPDYAIIDNERQTEIIKETLTSASERLFSLPPDDIKRISLEKRLLRHNNNWFALSGELTEIVRGRDRFADLIRFVRDIADHGLSSLSSVIHERLRVYIEGFLSMLHKRFLRSQLGGRWNDLFAHLSSLKAEAALVIPPTLPSDSWEDLPVWHRIADTLLTKEGTPRKVMGPAKGFYSGFGKTEWGQLIAGLDKDISRTLHETRDFPLADEPERGTEELSDFIILAAEVIQEYEAACRRRHVADFIDLEQAALRILDGNIPSDLHLYLDYRIGHLLVDEFQDTNENQWGLIQRLCSGWTPGDGKTVFIVGDPKQSIYAFRNAEVRLFFEAKKGIPLSGHGTLHLADHQLKTNFRSTKQLIEWTNDLFGKTVMVHPDYDADEVPFSPSVPTDHTHQSNQINQIDQTNQHNQSNPKPISLNLFYDKDSEAAMDREASWLARKTKETLEKTGGKQSIAVLLFTRNRLQRYLRAFKVEDVPLQVAEGLMLKSRPEVIHLIQTARAFVNPHDDLAWASLMRSPWSWFDKKILYETTVKDPESWTEKIRLSSLSNPAMEVLVRACDHALLRIGRDSLGKIVRRFWEDLDGPRKTAFLYGMAGVSNCRRFFRLLEEGERGIPLDTLDNLESIIDSVYEPSDPRASLSPVHLMTIHKAKGLEFDIVFLPFMDWEPLKSGPNIPPPYLLEKIPGTGGKHIMAMGGDYRTGESSKTYNVLRKLKKNRKWGEAKRWFYVAATRARIVLIMSGIATLKDEDIVVPRKSILRFLMEHEHIDNTTAEGQTIEVIHNPEIAPVHSKSDRWKADRSEPYALSPERLPYVVRNPSSADSDRIPAFEPAGETMERTGDVSYESIRGTIIHEIIKTAIGGRPLPSVKAVAIALSREGTPKEYALQSASEILSEAERTVNSPFIAGLINNTNPLVKTECAIEDIPQEAHLRSGILDLLVFDGRSWWICDFKTARPLKDETVDAFVRREKELYRSQLAAYASMLASVNSIEERYIRKGIFLTAIRRWEEY